MNIVNTKDDPSNCSAGRLRCSLGSCGMEVIIIIIMIIYKTKLKLDKEVGVGGCG